MEFLGSRLLKGKRVYLGAMSRDYIPLYAQWFSDLETLGLTGTNHVLPQTEESERAWYEWLKENNNYSFAICLIEEERPIGNLILKTPDWRSRFCEVGIAIGDKDYWGEGYGTEAMQIALRYAFLELNLNRVELGVSAFNSRAIRSYEKCGFKTEAVQREALYRDGKYHDIVAMAILREE